MASLAGDLVQPQSIIPVGSLDPEKNCGAVARNIVRVIRKACTGEEEGGKAAWQNGIQHSPCNSSAQSKARNPLYSVPGFCKRSG